MKKLLLALCLVLCLSAALIGCGKNEGDGTSTPLTDAPTVPATDAPTDAPTAAPTAAPTDAPTDPPTVPPTNAPTDAPTDAPTLPPTDAPTDSPTTAPKPPQDPGSVIYFGTPTIDGYLDDIYLDSFCYEEPAMKNLIYPSSPSGVESAKEHMPYTEGLAYYLYDEEYLYVCAIVHDETICSMGEEWRNKTTWPWNDDGAEIYFWFSDEDCFAIHCDAANIRAVRDEHVFGDNHDSSRVYSTVDRADWCAVIDEDAMEYVVEIRVALPDYVGEGSMFGTILEIDDRWEVSNNNNMLGALCIMPRFPGAEDLQVELGYTKAE